MFSKKIAYRRLRREMIDANLSIADIAREFGMNRDTLSRKLAKEQPIQLSDAFLIRDRYFPEVDIADLFQESVPSSLSENDKVPL